MTDCWGNLKLPGESHPKRRQVCTLCQEELEIENRSESFSDTSAKLQDIYVVLDDRKLLTESKKNVHISDVSMASMVATTRDKGGIDAATLAKNWGIGIESTEMTLLISPQLPSRPGTIHPELRTKNQLQSLPFASQIHAHRMRPHHGLQ
jgi:hypothetical protein